MLHEDFARQLNGSEYDAELTDEQEVFAKENGLVVVFGASDDLCEFRGAIDDEYGCYDGGVVKIDKDGIFPSWDDVSDDEDEAEKYFSRKKVAKEITIQFCEVDPYSWTYETDIPHSTFDIMEDGEKYCRGIVFEISSLN